MWNTFSGTASDSATYELTITPTERYCMFAASQLFWVGMNTRRQNLQF